jgi:hypothetical protein
MYGDIRRRKDGVDWCVGRVDTGAFVVIPAVGVQVIDYLASGLTVAEVHNRLTDETGRDIDVLDFVMGLDELGLVAAVDGIDVPTESHARPTLRRLQSKHVRWTLSPLLGVFVCLFVLSAAATFLFVPNSLPSGRDLNWADAGGLVLVGNGLITWSVALAHELGHLVTARAAGVPGRMRLGTRLQLLVVQTDVSGIWGEPRRVRLTVYMSGIAINLFVAALAIWLRLAFPIGLIHALLSATVVLSFSMVLLEFLVFMRTDVYFLLQDLTRCRNLYTDGLDYARYICSSIRLRLTARTNSARMDPSMDLPAGERRAVRLYSALLVVGSAVFITFFLFVTAPFLWGLLRSAITSLFHPKSSLDVIDSSFVLLVVAGIQIAWLRAWWTRHGTRIKAWRQRRRGNTHRRQT